jgi:DNA primase
MDRHWLEEQKRRWGLLEYLGQCEWRPCRRISHEQVAGLCPLHAETKPSFFVHSGKNLFYCHGCGQGGDLIRFVQLYHGLRFRQAIGHLRQWFEGDRLLADTVSFYRLQLDRCPEASAYLAGRGLQDPAIVAAMGIGYAPGACLRRHLLGLGYTTEQLRHAGLINAQGLDTLYRRVVFPCGPANLYGRSIGDGPAHRFLSASKGGLFRWDQLQQAEEITLVEGIFDVAALWQARLPYATCGWGAHLNRTQMEQLCTGQRRIRIAFDGDATGQDAARLLAERLRQRRQSTTIVRVPPGHDPASWFAAGATAADFLQLTEEPVP